MHWFVSNSSLAETFAVRREFFFLGIGHSRKLRSDIGFWFVYCYTQHSYKNFVVGYIIVDISLKSI